MPTENTRVSKLRCEIEVYVASCNSRLQPSFLCPDPAESSVPAANPVEEIKTRTAMETIHEFACFCMRPRIVPAGGRFVNLSGPPGEYSPRRRIVLSILESSQRLCRTKLWSS